MQPTHTPSHDRASLSLFALALMTFSLLPTPAHAQELAAAATSPASLVSSTSETSSAPLLVAAAPETSSSSALPESPEPQQQTSASGQPLAGPGHKVPRQASATDPVISPGQIAPNQTARDKFVLSIKNSISPFALAGDTISAGYSHLTNGSPNYGTDGDAFAQRFGAAVARGSSQNIFSSGIMAPILHEDPRYYQLGRSHSIVNRGVYAATRVLVTRRDNGRSSPNLALLSGYLGAALLTQTYYPLKNTSFTEIASTYGSSLGGAAIGNLVSEFLSDTLQVLHLKRTE